MNKYKFVYLTEDGWQPMFLPIEAENLVDAANDARSRLRVAQTEGRVKPFTAVKGQRM